MRIIKLRKTDTYFEDGWFVFPANGFEYILRSMLATRATLSYTTGDVKLYLEEQGILLFTGTSGKVFNIGAAEKLLEEVQELIRKDDEQLKCL